MTWRPRYPSGNVTAAVLGDPAIDRVERAEALRLSLPDPRPDERGDIDEPDALRQAIRRRAATIAEHFGLVRDETGVAATTTTDRSAVEVP